MPHLLPNSFHFTKSSRPPNRHYIRGVQPAACGPPGCVVQPATTFINRVAYEPAHNNGCGPLPKKVGHQCAV